MHLEETNAEIEQYAVEEIDVYVLTCQWVMKDE